MYDYNYNVKYKDIEIELTNKNEYDADDIETICLKIYEDELSQVCGGDNIFDEKIDIEINSQMEFLNDLLKIYNISDDEYIKYKMFSYPCFFLTHQIIRALYYNLSTDEYIHLLISVLKNQNANTN